ncbi:MAG: pirin family protein [Erythrobacter sp.]
MTTPAITETVTPVTHDLGAFEVRRVLPAKARTMIGPFIFVDQFGPADLAGDGLNVRPHPHINLATVTWLFDGAIDHRDSLGSFATIRPGQVNLMTAGRGIVHSERSPQGELAINPAMFGMQTWLALPDGQEEIAPAFEAVTDLPVVQASGAKAWVIMGDLWGAQAATTTYAHTIYAEILLEAGGAIPIDAAADERGLLLINGDAAVDGAPLVQYGLAVLAPGKPMKLTSQRGARVMLLGGEAFTSARHVWWNFVSSRPERIAQAREDWAAGRFPVVPGDTHEFIPLPESANQASHPPRAE